MAKLKLPVPPVPPQLKPLPTRPGKVYGPQTPIEHAGEAADQACDHDTRDGACDEGAAHLNERNDRGRRQHGAGRML